MMATTQSRRRKDVEGAASPDVPLSHERVAERAYELYVERGSEDGHDVEDWLRAEAELTAGEKEAVRSRRTPSA
jgi:hypothetical protein